MSPRLAIFLIAAVVWANACGDVNSTNDQIAEPIAGGQIISTFSTIAVQGKDEPGGWLPFICGGAIFHADPERQLACVVTAGHCLTPDPANPQTALTGGRSLQTIFFRSRVNGLVKSFSLPSPNNQMILGQVAYRAPGVDLGVLVTSYLPPTTRALYLPSSPFTSLTSVTHQSTSSLSVTESALIGPIIAIPPATANQNAGWYDLVTAVNVTPLANRNVGTASDTEEVVMWESMRSSSEDGTLFNIQPRRCFARAKRISSSTIHVRQGIGGHPRTASDNDIMHCDSFIGANDSGSVLYSYNYNSFTQTYAPTSVLGIMSGNSTTGYTYFSTVYSRADALMTQCRLLMDTVGAPPGDLVATTATSQPNGCVENWDLASFDYEMTRRRAAGTGGLGQRRIDEIDRYDIDGNGKTDQKDRDIIVENMGIGQCRVSGGS